jgi:hypothetical protein
MNKREFFKHAGQFGAGVAASALPLSAQALDIPAWLMRGVLGNGILGVMPFGCRATRKIAIRQAVPEQRLALYRELLPKQFDMHEKPSIYAYFIEFSKSYPVDGGPSLEASVLIRAVYKGDTKNSAQKGGWFPLTMPVSNQFALQAGLPFGYPKHMAKMAATFSFDGSNGTSTRRGLPEFNINWKPADVVVSNMEDEASDMPIYLVDKNGCVNIVENVIRKMTSRECRNGIIGMHIDATDPWVNLLGSRDIQGPGTVTMETGAFDMVRRSR